MMLIKRLKYIYQIYKSKQIIIRNGYKPKYIICHPITKRIIIKSYFVKKRISKLWNLTNEDDLDDYEYMLFGLQIVHDTECKKDIIYILNKSEE